MLEVKEGLSICGGMYHNDSWCDIYCDRMGAAIIEDESGCWYLSEMNLGKPIGWSDSNNVKVMVDDGDFGECLGAVYSGDGSGRVFVILSEEEFEERFMWAPAEAGKSYVLDMWGEYDPDYEE